MGKYKPYDYTQTMMVPVSLSDQLVTGTLEHTIHYVVEERLELADFDAKYCNDETGRLAYDPKVLLKIVLFGYSRGLKGSRKLERACRENITFMALACGQAPDHSTIAEFVSSMGEDRVESLFTQVLLVCCEEGLLGGTHFSIDGLKLSSNASKEWSGTHSDLHKKKEKLQALVKEAMREHRRVDREGNDERKAELKRTEKLKRRAERIEQFLATNKPRIGRQKKEIQSNITDTDSAKMKTSHGIVQGYNANACVDGDHQVVVFAQAKGEGDDGVNAAPMLEGARANLEAAGLDLEEAVVSADTSYYSVENLRACREAGVDAYIPDRQFRSRDARFAEAKRHRRATDRYKQDHKRKAPRWFTAADFDYDATTGRMTCPAGHRMNTSGEEIRTTSGYQAMSFKAPTAACRSCKMRTQCLKNPEQKSPRQVRIFFEKHKGTLTEAMKTKIDTPEGRKIYSRRLGIIEPVFANIRAQKSLDRFTLRGESKVNVQWKLYCMVHNLEKLGKYGTGRN